MWKPTIVAVLGGLLFFKPVDGVASTLTVEQYFEYEYSYIPKCTAFDQFDACTSYPDPRDPRIKVEKERLTNSALGQSVRLVPSLGNEAFRSFEGNSGESLYAEFTTDVRAGEPIKTKTEMFYESDKKGGAENKDELTDVKLLAYSQLNFRDQVETTDPNGKIFRFETTITGTLRSIRAYGVETPGGLYPETQDLPGAEYRNLLLFGSTLGNNIDLQGEDLIETDPAGEQKSGFIEAEKPVDETYVFNDISYNGVAQTFVFYLTNWTSLEVRGIDADESRAFMANDLGNTITTYASVFDAAGNLLPDARVRSSLSGFEYAPLARFTDNSGSDTSPVPTPSTLVLLAVGLSMMAIRSRKAPER